MMVHGSLATFFPFKSQAQPHPITYNIITANRPQIDPTFDINRNRIAQLAPFYYRNAHIPTALRVQLTGAAPYANSGLVTLPFDGHPYGFGFGGFSHNIARGVPYPILLTSAAPTPILF